MTSRLYRMETLSIVGAGEMSRGIARQRTATPQDIDLAVMLNLDYPKGPLALSDALGATRILTILHPICAPLNDQCYRPSPWLARRAQLGLSLLHVEGDAPQHEGVHR
ncbi:hypothetical protein IHE33_08645 [Mycetohabitans endofungorum]